MIDDELFCGQWDLWDKAYQPWKDLLENILFGIRLCNLFEKKQDFDSSKSRRLHVSLALLYPNAYTYQWIWNTSFTMEMYNIEHFF